MTDTDMHLDDASDAVTDLYWFDGFLMKVLVHADDTKGALSVCEQRHPNGYRTPVHRHGREDQTLYVLAGQITGWLDPGGAGHREIVATAGETVFLPRGVAHAFRVDAEGTRLLEINTPGGFEHFHIEAGERALEDRLPDPAPPDIERLVRVGGDYGCEIVGPPFG